MSLPRDKADNKDDDKIHINQTVYRISDFNLNEKYNNTKLTLFDDIHVDNNVKDMKTNFLKFKELQINQHKIKSRINSDICKTTEGSTINKDKKINDNIHIDNRDKFFKNLNISHDNFLLDNLPQPHIYNGNNHNYSYHDIRRYSRDPFIFEKDEETENLPQKEYKSNDSYLDNKTKSISLLSKSEYTYTSSESRITKSEDSSPVALIQKRDSIRLNTNIKIDGKNIYFTLEFIDNLLKNSDRRASVRLYPNELNFVKDIMKHETRLEDDTEVSYLFDCLKMSEFLVTYFTIVSMLSAIFYFEFKSQEKYNLGNAELYNDSFASAKFVSLLVVSMSTLFYSIYII